jgi:hypothetical protein
MEWLRAMLLKSDTPVTSAMREAKRLGFSYSTVRRAREDLKVRMYRDEGGPCSSGWWTLRPKTDAPNLPPDWVPDAAALAGIQNWEGVPEETPELAGDVPETLSQAGKPDLRRPERAATGRNGRAAQRHSRESGNGRKSHARQDATRDAAAPLADIPDILWERLRGPLLSAILGTGAEGDDSAGGLVISGHSASRSDDLKRSSNGKRRKPKPK